MIHLLALAIIAVTVGIRLSRCYSMKQLIYGAFKRYNANTKDINKGDCSARAMSLAYGLDYDAVYNELKKLQKSKNRSAYNTIANIYDFIDKHGGKVILLESNDITVEEFSANHSSSTYLLLTGKSPTSRIRHMVALLDGDIYDSWNSSDEYVKDVILVTEDNANLHGNEFDMITAANQIWEPLERYIDTQNHKTEIMYVGLQQLSAVGNDTLLIELKCYLDDTVSIYSKFKKSEIIHKKFIAKFNLKKTQNENVQTLIPKLRTKIYDWMYNIRKDIEDSKKSELSLRDDFRGDRLVAVKLPEWSYPFLRHATSKGFNYKFEAEMYALDGDPRKSSSPVVYFRAVSLSELQSQFNDYIVDFSRYGYDY